MSDSFEARAKSLEDAWFLKADAEAIQRLREKTERAYTKQDLSGLTGITNEQVLDALADLKIGGAAVLVMAYFPMVAVAWADGVIEEAEKALILQLVAAMGAPQGGPAHAYLDTWLTQKPEPSWMKLWTDYVHALSEKMKPDDKALLKNTVLGRARVVAEASGGLLGVLWSISDAERRVIAELDAAFR
jgi:hypothetical protein